MEFWNYAYQFGWVTAEKLRLAVITEQNKFGEITPEEYEQITGEKF